MKVLLITHNPICTNNNMGKTFLSLFSEFDRDQLCQLYVHSAIPDVEVCSSYFQITDKQILKSLPFGHPGGEIVPEQIAEQEEKRKNGTLTVPRPYAGAGAVFRLLRDAVWKMARWYSKELEMWLDREKPTCIFLAPGYAKFIYDIALKISEERNLPIVTYVCDDYYFVKCPKGILEKLQLRGLQNKTDRLMSKTQRLVVISEELKETYKSYFGVATDVVMTGACIPTIGTLPVNRDVQTLSYFGNLSAGRHVSLADIGRVVDEVNSTHHTNLALKIYTSETSSEILGVLDGISCVNFCGFVAGKAFEDAFAASDILIHTESFEVSNMDLVKHSVSTKIADSLASGIPMLAYGPENISSMKHLIRNECALVATSKDDLKIVLEQALVDEKGRHCISQNAIRTAAIYHDKERNSAKLKSIFADIGTV